VRHEDELRQAEAHDHARAGERGERLRDLSNAVVSELLGAGILLSDPRAARVVVFSTLADCLHGNRSVDIPGDLGSP
jgi:hypothetical protein